MKISSLQPVSGFKLQFTKFCNKENFIFPSQPNIFVLQNNPLQAFLVSKTFKHIEKNAHAHAHMSVKA